MRRDELESAIEHTDASSGRYAMDLVYLGFNSRVVALSRATGELVWEWVSPTHLGSDLAVLLDGDTLVVSICGYTYGLDPTTGRQLWYNPLKGKGTGTPILVSLRGKSGSAASTAVFAEREQRAREAGGA